MTQLWLIPLGFVVGAFGTLIGAGGGFVLVPALLFIYPEKRPVTITSISLAVVFFNALSGSAAYLRQKRVDLRTGVIFAAATVPGAILGSLVVGHISRGLFDIIFGAALVVLSLLIILRTGARVAMTPEAKPGHVSRVVIDIRGERYEYSFNQTTGIAISVAVGFLSSLLGIGGGIIHVPALVEFLNFPVHIATATSHFILAIMALAGTVVHILNGELTPDDGFSQVALLAVGVVPGAQVGAHLSHRLHGGAIIRLLGGALLLVGIRLLLSPLL